VTSPHPEPTPGKWLCPGCEASVSLADTVEEPVCASCGSRLVQINRRDDDDMVGQVIDGRFEIRAFLGEGGMGTVYRAWQRSIGRDVAIKLIDKRHGRDEMAVRRFLREARLASQLSQPNTVSVFDVGQSKDGRLFLAMELIRGRTLDKVVQDDGAFSQQRAARIGVQMCDALEAASRLQIVHRDLKPANVIMLDDPPGRDLIKVLDFGLAKSLVGDESEATQSGLIVGTPRYMSPEVLMGSAQTVSSDLYAVGVILGELVAGIVMWQATAFPVLLANKVDGSEITQALPQPIRGIVERLIDAEPSGRYASPSDLRAALMPLLELRADVGRNALAVTAPEGHARTSATEPTVAFSAVTGTPAVAAGTPAPLELATVSPVRFKPAPAPAPAPGLIDKPVAPLGSGTALPSTVTSTRRPPWVAIGVIAVALAGVAVFLATRGGDAKPAPEQAPAPQADVKRPDPPPVRPAPVIAPDAGVEPGIAPGIGIDLGPATIDVKPAKPPKKKRGKGTAPPDDDGPPKKTKEALPF